jgi:hypothetical protein
MRNVICGKKMGKRCIFTIIVRVKCFDRFIKVFFNNGFNLIKIFFYF